MTIPYSEAIIYFHVVQDGTQKRLSDYDVNTTGSFGDEFLFHHHKALFLTRSVFFGVRDSPSQSLFGTVPQRCKSSVCCFLMRVLFSGIKMLKLEQKFCLLCVKAL